MARIDKMRLSIPILTLLQAMGFTNKKIIHTLKGKTMTQENLKTSQALYKLNKILMNKWFEKLNIK